MLLSLKNLQKNYPGFSLDGLVRCSGKHSMKNVLVKAMERKK